MESDSAGKINEALALLNEAAKEKKDELSTLLEGKYDSLKQAFINMESEVEDHARRGFSKTCDLAREAKEKADRQVHEEPWKTISWAVVGAFVLGFLIGNRD